MLAGTLRRRITFQSRTTTRDTFGAEQETWNNVATVWGDVQDLRGSKFLAAEQYEAQVTTMIIIRYRTDITPAMRAVVSDENRTFDVQSIRDEEGRHRELVLGCLERVGQ